MIRLFKIVKEFGADDHAFWYMVNAAGGNIDKLVCVGNLVYCPLGGGRVFEVDHLIMPAIISVDIDKEVSVSRVTEANFRKYGECSYIAVDRKHSFVAYKFPGAAVPLIGHLAGIETLQLKSTNFDKKAGY